MALLLLISFQKGERVLYLGQVPSNVFWLGSLLSAREGERLKVYGLGLVLSLSMIYILPYQTAISYPAGFGLVGLSLLTLFLCRATKKDLLGMAWWTE